MQSMSVTHSDVMNFLTSLLMRSIGIKTLRLYTLSCHRRRLTSFLAHVQYIMSQIIRKYATTANSFYVTTPIYYVNAPPHIGHLYSSVIADAIQKWNKLMAHDKDIYFATGTDEHGIKIQQAAVSKNVSLPDYCNNISNSYKDLFKKFGIDYSGFIRTTDEKHKKAVHHLWETIDKAGHIYTSKYSGWYCVSDETFLTDIELKDQILPNGNSIKVSAQSGHPVEWTEEENYMFKLSNFQDNLKHWLLKNEDVVKPNKFHKILFDSITREELPDVSISRPNTRVHWGIPVPGDEQQTIYVWMDALVNYLSILGYPDESYKKFWPPSVQVIGKDILKFHGIYWPAFLMAANLDLPKTILCHSHWTVDVEKMSKSKGNVICPIERSNTYTTDGIRYFLLREGVAHSDGNYSDTKIVRILNSELADTLGNLLSRCTGANLNTKQIFPRVDKDVFREVMGNGVGEQLMKSLETLVDTCYQHYADYNFYKVVDAVIATLHIANLFFETMKPWELKKNENTLDKLNVIIHVAMETLRISGIILQPIIPNLSSNLLDKLSIANDERYWKDAKCFSWENEKFKDVSLSAEKIVLFQRIITEGEVKPKIEKKPKKKKAKVV